MPRKAAKPKLGFMEKLDRRYKRYSPEVEGYGKPGDWKHSFQVRMGLDEAAEILRGNSPRTLLQVGQDATWEEVRSQYRKLSMGCHPDRCATHHLTHEVAEKTFKSITAAYVLLQDEYGE